MLIFVNHFTGRKHISAVLLAGVTWRFWHLLIFGLWKFHEVSNHQAPAHHMMLLQVSKFQPRWPVSLAAAIWSGTHFVWVGWITLRDEPSGNPFILKDIDCSVRLLLIRCTYLGAWPIWRNLQISAQPGKKKKSADSCRPPGLCTMYLNDSECVNMKFGSIWHNYSRTTVALRTELSSCQQEWNAHFRNTFLGCYGPHPSIPLH